MIRYFTFAATLFYNIGHAQQGNLPTPVTKLAPSTHRGWRRSDLHDCRRLTMKYLLAAALLAVTAAPAAARDCSLIIGHLDYCVRFMEALRKIGK